MHDPIMTGPEFARARQELGLTQSDFADALGISLSQEKRFERATEDNPVTERVAAMARLIAFGEWSKAWPDKHRPPEPEGDDLRQILGDVFKGMTPGPIPEPLIDLILGSLLIRAGTVLKERYQERQPLEG